MRRLSQKKRYLDQDCSLRLNGNSPPVAGSHFEREKGEKDEGGESLASDFAEERHPVHANWSKQSKRPDFAVLAGAAEAQASEGSIPPEMKKEELGGVPGRKPW